MRVSRLMLVTQRDIPADAEITSHQLLLRGGFIRRVTSGVYAYMPLMWKVIKKINQIVREELDQVGCLETLLPQLHPCELWEKSNRWKSYTAGEGIMFHLTDRQGKDLGLGPTHEEVITKLASEMLNSYKQLPVSLYQIQTKFRDEIRPRFGLMRSREFIMKDAYSFHTDQSDLQREYNVMNKVYKTIFTRCGLKTISVEADSGAIGGAASQEFMVTADSGEDSILFSNDGKYAANQEKAISIPKKSTKLEKSAEDYFKSEQDEFSINKICRKNNLDGTQIIKVLVFIAEMDTSINYPILVSIRGDQEVNIVKLNNVLNNILDGNILRIKSMDRYSKSMESTNIPFGFIGPDLNNKFLDQINNLTHEFIRIIDHSAAELEDFVCGANEIGLHKSFCNWSSLGGVKTSYDVRQSKAGDKCKHDSNSTLIEKRGIEVGHIFQLGTKYSNSLQAFYTNNQGIQEPLWMGCYGIGVSRLAQASVEQSHDDKGIIWPVSIAPYSVVIVIANMKELTQVELGEMLYKEFLTNDIEVLIDDRQERAGVKFKDADLIGIPFRVVVGRESSVGKVELYNRSNGDCESVLAENLLKKLKTLI